MTPGGGEKLNFKFKFFLPSKFFEPPFAGSQGEAIPEPPGGVRGGGSPPGKKNLKSLPDRSHGNLADRGAVEHFFTILCALGI